MKNKGQVDVNISHGRMRLQSKDAEGFFTESISTICDHLSNLFDEEVNGIETIILVGGYAECPLLINAIKKKFPQMRILIPYEAMYAVLKGALICCYDPSYIKQRRSRCTYGIRVRHPFDSSKHDETYKYEEDGKVWCGSLFSKLVEIDQPVNVGEYQRKKSYTMNEACSTGNLSLYCSPSKNPKYTDEEGCCFIGHILSRGHQFLPNEDISIKMRFGETEIKFKAYQRKSRLHATYYLSL
jgi:hypothetical protein